MNFFFVKFSNFNIFWNKNNPLIFMYFILFYFILSKGTPTRGSRTDRTSYLIPYFHGNISSKK